MIDKGSLEFRATTLVKMKDLKGNVLWEKSFTYKGSNFKRIHSVEDFKAEDGFILQEEMEFAADTTASDFIRHFESGRK
jgi:hypothetical protein